MKSFYDLSLKEISKYSKEFNTTVPYGRRSIWAMVITVVIFLVFFCIAMITVAICATNESGEVPDLTSYFDALSFFFIILVLCEGIHHELAFHRWLSLSKKIRT